MRAGDHRALVLEVETHPLPYFTLALELPDEWGEAKAGQFLMIQAAAGLDPYLRRAFSIHDVSKGPGGVRVEILAKVVGRGTARLAELRPGERVAVLGPLGQPFRAAPPGRAALVAGGVGSAPLLLLARQLLAHRHPFAVFYGGRSRDDLARRELFAELAEAAGGELVATTEDGSWGRRGLVTEPLAEALSGGAFQFLYACGPHGLLARLAHLAATAQVAGEAALETPMGCGFGACLGCAVTTATGAFALCCKDGPVFGLNQVRW